MDSKPFKVGDYIPDFNIITGQSLPCGPIYQSPGLRKHIQKHQVERASLLSDIPTVIRSPDYLGHNPKEPNSIEIVKKMQDNVMVCVKLDSQNGYLYVASAFIISDSKLSNRLNSGRVKKVDISPKK